MSKINSAIVIDFETGGLDCKKNPAIQVAYQAVQLDDYKLILEYSSYIQPYDGLEIQKAATDYSGITYEMMMSGLDTKRLVKKLCEDFTEANTSKNFRTKPFLVGHNIGFDIGFLLYLFNKEKVDISKFLNCNHGMPTSIDTILLAKQKWANDPTVSKYNLGACVAKAGIALTDAHDALNDVRATKELFFYFTNNLRTGGAISEESKAIRVRNHFKF